MIHYFLDFYKLLTTPERLIALLSTVMTGWLGYSLLFAIVFSETGLLVGFVLPGDSLLFTIGVVAGAGQLNIVLVDALLILAALCGDTLNYFLGRSIGPRVFSREDSRYFRRDHLLRTQTFYDRHGGKTLIYARFIPIIRTFAPFVAGVGQMPYLRFLSFSVFGGIGWVLLMTLLGYSLGNIPIVRHNFEKVILGIVLLSLVPAILEAWKARRAAPGASPTTEAAVGK
jgi:membrane-associated protein